VKEILVIFLFVTAIGFLASIFIDRVINPWEHKKSFKKFLKDAAEGKIKTSRFDISIVWNSTGFVVQNDKTGEQSKQLAWKEIAKVTAFKRDFFSVDCICLNLAKSDETNLEVREEMNGWKKFIEDLSNFLSGCKPPSEWVFQVSYPAFKPNVTEIFLRGGSI
jgi:hypothetical protein